MINERENDGLKIIENVLRQFSDKLDLQDKNKLEDMLVYYRYGNPAELQDFPYIKAFLGMEVADGAGDDEENAGRVPSAAETLNELRNIMNAHECIEGTVLF